MLCYGPLVSELGGPESMVPPTPSLGGPVSPRPPGSAAHDGTQWETLSLITQERIGVGASNLVEIIDVGVDAYGILSRSVGQTNRK